jgi:hypothetical protein
LHLADIPAALFWFVLKNCYGDRDKKDMNEQPNWLKIFIAIAIGLALIAAVSFWQFQQNLDEVAIAPLGCIVRFSPDGTSEIIPFGDVRCPQNLR